MKKILKILATVLLLCSVLFLGGTWPENTPRKKVVAYDGGALVTALICGLYIKRKNGEENEIH